MAETHDRGEAGPRVFRLGMKIWHQERTHPDEEDEWRGEVYYQVEPWIRGGFRGLDGMSGVVMQVVDRIRGRERAAISRGPESRGSDTGDGSDRGRSGNDPNGSASDA